MTTENEEWILDIESHVSNPGLIYTEMDFFQGAIFSYYSFCHDEPR